MGGVDRDAIGLAVHDIAMMVQVLLNAIETMQGNDAAPRAFEMPYSEGEMLSSSRSIWRSGSRLCGTV
jgi:hypothetical protein